MIEAINSAISAIHEFLIEHWVALIVVGIAWLFIKANLNALWHSYIHRIKHKFLHDMKWVVFQLRFPRENLKSPKAMEQVIASLHGTYSFGIAWRRELLLGYVEDRFCLEMVGRSTGISFYARVMAGQKNMFKAAFFAQYPEVEIVEVPDYVDELPKDLPDETYTLFGTDYLLDKGKHTHLPLDAYPIKTYPFFESPDEDQRLDPMATIAEAVSNLKGEETILIQLIFQPTGINEHPTLKEARDTIINKIMKRKEKAHGPGILDALWNFTKNIFYGFFAAPNFGEEHAAEEKITFAMQTPIEQEIMKGVENKMSKNLFETVIRFIYIDRKDSFTNSNVAAVFGAITQFSERNMNSLSPSKGTTIFAEYLDFIKGDPKNFFKEQRLDGRRRNLYQAFREREMPLDDHVTPWDKHVKEFFVCTSVLSAEELATIFHPPGVPVTATQKMAPVQAKKVGPPLTLPTFEG